MAPLTTEQQTLFPEIRVSGNRFTLAGPAEQNAAAPAETGPAGPAAAGTAPEERTGIIPRHVWG